MTICEICQYEGLGECKTCERGNPCLGCEYEKNCQGQCIREEIVDKLIDIPN